jgi:hypothetical protein
MNPEKGEALPGDSKSLLVQKASAEAAKRPVASKDVVLKAETIEIAKQRARREMPGDPGAPSVGLSLSGGGIRSATFALGALQTFCRLELPVLGKPRRALVEFIDYLSTVSGGGYIGSWFVANRKREMEEKNKAGTDFATNPADTCRDCDKATEQVAHLRRYSHYLNPDPGIMSADTWTMVTIWLRNTLLIQAMVFCVLASCFMLPHLWLRVVDSIPRVIGAGCFASFRWTEAAFPLAILACFAVAYRQARKEIALFTEDKKVDTGDAKADALHPIDQKRVQVCIVLPAVVAALLTTLWLWLHHMRLNMQTTVVSELKNQFSDGVGLGWLDSNMVWLQNACVEAGPVQTLKAASWRDWWAGMETTTILASPWMILMTLAVVRMAYRLMWLKEDQEAQEKRGGPFWKKVRAWLTQYCRHFTRGKPAPAGPGPLKTTWKPWCEQMRTDHEGFRRFFFYWSLVAGSLFSLYLIDEAFRSIHETKISFAQPKPAVHLELGLPHGQLNAEYTPPGASSKGFDIGAAWLRRWAPR